MPFHLNLIDQIAPMEADVSTKSADVGQVPAETHGVSLCATGGCRRKAVRGGGRQAHPRGGSQANNTKRANFLLITEIGAVCSVTFPVWVAAIGLKFRWRAQPPLTVPLRGSMCWILHEKREGGQGRGWGCNTWFELLVVVGTNQTHLGPNPHRDFKSPHACEE